MKIVKTKKRDLEFLADNKINASFLKKYKVVLMAVAPQVLTMILQLISKKLCLEINLVST
jgi:hypothetical protein